MGSNNRILQRVYFIYVLMILAGLGIFTRTVMIQVAEGEYWRSRAQAANLRYETVEAARGNIFF